jgi:hypothetical protein
MPMRNCRSNKRTAPGSARGACHRCQPRLELRASSPRRRCSMVAVNSPQVWMCSARATCTAVLLPLAAIIPHRRCSTCSRRQGRSAASRRPRPVGKRRSRILPGSGRRTMPATSSARAAATSAPAPPVGAGPCHVLQHGGLARVLLSASTQSGRCYRIGGACLAGQAQRLLKWVSALDVRWCHHLPEMRLACRQQMMVFCTAAALTPTLSLKRRPASSKRVLPLGTAQKA